MLTRYLDDKPTFEMRSLRVDGHERDNVGVGIVQGKVYLPHAQKDMRVRATYLRTPKKGVWHIDHFHHSSLLANMENIGFVAHGVEDLLQAASVVPLDQGRTGMATVMFTDIVGSTTLADSSSRVP